MMRSLGLVVAAMMTCWALASGAQPLRTAQPLCEIPPTFDRGVSPTREIFVAPPPVGSDSGGDGSAQRPFATIQRAASAATAGTAVRVRAGVYSGGSFISGLRGRADTPIWIGGAPNPGGVVDRPIIQGGPEGLHLARCAYVVIHDLEVRTVSANGINSDDGGVYDDATAAHHQVFRSLFIHDVGSNGNQDGLKLSGVREFTVLDCEIARCGGSASGSGIDLVGCHAGVIARSKFHDLSANAVQAKGGSTGVLITRCRMENAGERALNLGGSTGFEFFRPPLSTTAPNAEARDIRAVANIIIGSRTPVAFVGATGCVFAHNTVIEPTRWLMRILQETTTSPPYDFDPCSNNTVTNNLFYFRRAAISADVNIGPNTAPETFVFRTDLWYAFDNPPRSAPVLPVPENGGIAGEDPRMCDPGAGNFAICLDSPAFSHASLPTASPADFTGRCYRTPAAIGAFEAPDEPPCKCPGVAKPRRP